MKKTLILLAALALSAASPGFAQSQNASPKATQNHGKGHDKCNKTPEQKAETRTARLTKELSLNSTQQAQVKQIMLARQQEQQALQARYGEDKKGAHAEMKALRARYEEKLRGTLTPDQYARYDKMQAEKHGKMKERRGDDKMKMKSKS